MHLSREEEEAYQGERGESLRRAMEILLALGDIYGADRLIPVASVQVAGVSFKTIGEAGLEWISDLKGKVEVPSVLNPAGMDLSRWREMGIDEEFAKKQIEIVDAYRRLGISPDCTCTPYQIRPDSARRGDHLAWSESSAVSFANSVIGAKTNREGAPRPWRRPWRERPPGTATTSKRTGFPPTKYQLMPTLRPQTMGFWDTSSEKRWAKGFRGSASEEGRKSTS